MFGFKVFAPGLKATKHNAGKMPFHRFQVNYAQGRTFHPIPRSADNRL